MDRKMMQQWFAYSAFSAFNALISTEDYAKYVAYVIMFVIGTKTIIDFMTPLVDTIPCEYTTPLAVCGIPLILGATRVVARPGLYGFIISVVLLAMDHAWRYCYKTRLYPAMLRRLHRQLGVPGM
jgi:hypothetical protein